MRISEIYGPVSQGEGALQGVLMPFVRVAGCNLSCSWCDSKYTWEHGYEYTDLLVDDIMVRLRRMLDATPNLMDRCVSITGGEPTLYAAELAELCQRIPAELDAAVIVETNGLRYVADAFNREEVFVSCSPKLPTSGQDTPTTRNKVRRFVEQRLAYHAAHADAQTQWKFVIASGLDLQMLPGYLASVGIPTDGSALIYLQPDGCIQPTSAYLAEYEDLKARAPSWALVTTQQHRIVHGPLARSV